MHQSKEKIQKNALKEGLNSMDHLKHTKRA
jgi:hypothetical protein